ncbi:MAG: beta-ketoacyl-ACP synthase III [Eubacteriales bacterium]|nr:beta-ketoacyl-ACP synthase III [Eubacteriales bacterium]
MKGIHIISTGSAVPETCYDNEKMSELVETSDEWIRTRTGIRSRHICKEESCVSLAVSAAGKAMERAGNPANRIGAVIVATSTGDYSFPSVACLVAKELGLGTDVMAFDLAAACSGFLYAMDVGRNFLLAHEDRYVLVIGAEQLSRIVDYTDRSTCILFGDGAGAALIEAADTPYFHHSGCDGDAEVLSCKGVGQDEMYIHMKGNSVFKFAVSTLKESIDRILREQKISMDEIDYVICHQANARIIDHVKKKYPGQEKKFYMNLERYGNTSAASIPMVIDELMELGELKEGMKIVCVGFGAGLTWGGTFLQI